MMKYEDRGKGRDMNVLRKVLATHYSGKNYKLLSSILKKTAPQTFSAFDRNSPECRRFRSHIKIMRHVWSLNLTEVQVQL
jgi:hypothetical protein